MPRSAIADDGINLGIVNGTAPGSIQLQWTGGAPSYLVFRSTDPASVVGNANEIGQTNASDWNDTPPSNSMLVFYIVSNLATVCPAGQALCSYGCADLTTDTSNCGACGNACPQAASCGGSQCQCPSGQVPGPAGCTDIPPDPATVAPVLDLTATTSLLNATSFLYSGTTPIQTGVSPGTIKPPQAAVLRGKVLDRSGQPLAGATLTILNHPEFGQTLSRLDGMFDLAVNGGGPLVLSYQRNGFPQVQRQIDVPWQDYAFVPDVVMTPYDAHATRIDFSTFCDASMTCTSNPMQVARGSPVSDADGARQATLIFSRGTVVTITLPDGNTITPAIFTVRATEYTVGPNGDKAMPGELPSQSAYTYAAEYSVDEAVAVGAKAVRFSPPVISYTENFLGFPVGTTVPSGYHDRQKGLWVASDSGRVIQILSITNGQADLDLDGSGQVASATALAALGINSDELKKLASLYNSGQSLWRVPVDHFSTWDSNWGVGPPPGAKAPANDPTQHNSLTCPQTQPASSVIECEDQALEEDIGVVGTPFRLHYKSDRVPGIRVPYTLDIPLTDIGYGSQFEVSPERVDLEIQVAGQLFQQSFGKGTPSPLGPGMRTTFTWDGKDAYGRTLHRAQPITVRIGYAYGAVYGFSTRFGYSSPLVVFGVPERKEVSLVRQWQGKIGAWDARSVGLGGWTLSAHHVYDPVERVVYRGDGGRQSANTLGPTIGTFAGGTNAGCFGGDGGPATQANVCPYGLAVGKDGSLYLASPLAAGVRKVAPDGTITTVAGSGTGLGCATPTGPCGDGGPATQARLNGPQAIAIGPDDSLYIGEDRAVVRRVAPNGIITTVAGTGVSGFSGDGGPAFLAQLGFVQSLAAGPDGSVYIDDLYNFRIRRIAPDGTISTVAGNGTAGGGGDGGPATSASLRDPRGIAVGRDGSLYIADGAGQRVRRVTPDGIVRTIAGNGTLGFSGDGGPATDATFRSVYGVAVGRDDTVYMVDQGNNRVRWMRPDGSINTLAGTGMATTSGDGGLARQATLQNLASGLTVAPDGSVYVSQTSNNPRVRRIAPLVEGFVASGYIPSPDGSEIYLFTQSGRHQQTFDGLTGAPRYQFSYDAGGRLATITDGNGNMTTIQRDAAGTPAAIVGPFGQRTTMLLDPNGYLGRVTSPGGEAVQLTYGAEGLLTDLMNPRGNSSHYSYDTSGRLTSATDPTTASKTISRSGTEDDYTVTMTSPLGRTTNYRVESLSNGDSRFTTTDAAGLQTQAVNGKDGTRTVTYPDGTVARATLGADPRWGLLAPVVATRTVTTPGGRVKTTTTQRTATLANASDPLSVRVLSETVTVNGKAFTRTYDATTRTITGTSPSGRRTSAIVVDTRGRLAQAQMGTLDPSSYTYDAQGRLVTVSQGTGGGSRAITLAYGSDGFLAGFTDPVNQSTGISTDTDGLISELVLPGGGRARLTYDPDGNVSALTPPGRPDHSFTYTQLDQVSMSSAPPVGAENNQTGYFYDADRRLIRVDRPIGQSVQFGYDGVGRLSLVHLVSGNVGYGYDSVGRLSTVSRDQGVALAYAYDGGLLTGLTWNGAVAGSVTGTYDNNRRIASLSVDGSNPIAFQFDPDDLPIQAGSLTLTRSAQSGLITGTTLGGVTDARTYDNFGAPAAYSAGYNGTPLYSVTYTRDQLGRLTSQSETVGGVMHVFAYTYEPGGRLTEVREDGVLVASYVHDANGNRLSRTDGNGTMSGAYDAQDRVGQYGAEGYANTPNGERQSKTNGGGTTTYEYDGLSHLTGATLSNGTQVAYLLDGQSRRVGKRINGTLVQGFLYQDEVHPIAELDGAGSVVSRFVYTAGAGVPAYMIKGGATYRIIADHIGSPRLVVDVATGAVAQRMDFDEFGNVLADSSPGFQPFGFAGGLLDRDTQLVHFGAREYDPEIGRWTTKDPIGFGGGNGNLYAYIGDDPVNSNDPEGLLPNTGIPNTVTVGVTAACATNQATCETLLEALGEAAPQLIQTAEAVGPAAAESLPCLQNVVAPVVDSVPAVIEDVAVIQGRLDGTVEVFSEVSPQVETFVANVGEVSTAANKVPDTMEELDAYGNNIYEWMRSTYSRYVEFSRTPRGSITRARPTGLGAESEWY